MAHPSVVRFEGELFTAGIRAKNEWAAPPLFRENIDAATAEKYGDPPRPTYEALRKTKSDRQIIESASRPIEYPDDRLTPGVPCAV